MSSKYIPRPSNTILRHVINAQQRRTWPPSFLFALISYIVGTIKSPATEEEMRRPAEGSEINSFKYYLDEKVAEMGEKRLGPVRRIFSLRTIDVCLRDNGGGTERGKRMNTTQPSQSSFKKKYIYVSFSFFSSFSLSQREHTHKKEWIDIPLGGVRGK